METDKDRLLTAADVAELLGVTAKTVYSYAGQGLISYRRVGGRLIRFTQSDVDSFVHGALREGPPHSGVS